MAFWTLRGDFDPAWWLPNLYLLVYPLFFMPALARAIAQQGKAEGMIREM